MIIVSQLTYTARILEGGWLTSTHTHTTTHTHTRSHTHTLEHTHTRTHTHTLTNTHTHAHCTHTTHTPYTPTDTNATANTTAHPHTHSTNTHTHTLEHTPTPRGQHGMSLMLMTRVLQNFCKRLRRLCGKTTMLETFPLFGWEISNLWWQVSAAHNFL